jgi:hypothetical protein
MGPADRVRLDARRSRALSNERKPATSTLATLAGLKPLPIVRSPNLAARRLLGQDPHVNTTLALILGATVSAIVALFVLIIQHHLERRAISRARTVERFSRFSSAAHEIGVALGDLAVAGAPDKAQAYAEVRLRLLGLFNELLAAVMIEDSDEIVMTARIIDADLGVLASKARQHAWTYADWLEQRQGLTSHLADFHVVARVATRRKALSQSLQYAAPSTGPH